MADKNPTIMLYELIKNKTDEQTAHNAINTLQGAVKSEVKTEIAQVITDFKIQVWERLSVLEVDMIDRINTSKTQTILWIVSIGLLQLVAHYLFK